MRDEKADLSEYIGSNEKFFLTCRLSVLAREIAECVSAKEPYAEEVLVHVFPTRKPGYIPKSNRNHGAFIVMKYDI